MGRLRVVSAIVGALSVRQPERVGLRADELARAKVLDGVFDQRPPDRHLLDVDAIQIAQFVE